MTDQPTSKERDAFEAWAADKFATHRSAYDPTRYLLEDTQRMWQAWQARADQAIRDRLTTEPEWNTARVVSYFRSFQMIEAANAVEAMQAKIDALMLEHCPGEMSAEQRAEWAKHQQPTAYTDPPIQSCDDGMRAMMHGPCNGLGCENCDDGTVVVVWPPAASAGEQNG